jgi:hypothetical protein
VDVSSFSTSIVDGRTVGSPNGLLALLGNKVGDSVVGMDDSGKGRLGGSTGDMGNSVRRMLGDSDECKLGNVVEGSGDAVEGKGDAVVGMGDAVEGMGESVKGMDDDVGMTDIGTVVCILGVAVSSSRRIVGLIVGKLVIAAGAVGAKGVQDENSPSKQIHCKKSSRDFS